MCVSMCNINVYKWGPASVPHSLCSQMDVDVVDRQVKGNMYLSICLLIHAWTAPAYAGHLAEGSYPATSL